MPELPDVVVYVEALERLLASRTLQKVIVKSPFVLRTFDPPIEDAVGTVEGFSRSGKRIIWEIRNEQTESDEHPLFLVFHLMIAGRFHWKKKPNTLPKGKLDLAAFQFEHGTMMLTEASKKKRASLHVVKGRESLKQFERSGLEVMTCSFDQFQERLTSQNRTLKRALTDPNIFSGIGNAYSDEILLNAKLSPLRRTSQLSDEESARLFEATTSTLTDWVDRLREQVGDSFPEKVTAFRPEMAAHGKFGEPCPYCNSPIQRIRYAENECNYCARCQTGGKLLADRSLSRLLKDDWPKTIDELES